MITIVNYGSGNIQAIGNIYERLRIPFAVADTPSQIRGAERLILPGVGAFDETIAMLDSTGFRAVLNEEVLEKKVPVLGICVGMQILAKSSEEGVLPGLGWIDGTVKKIDADLLTDKPKIPHLGWNAVSFSNATGLSEGIDEEKGFYFLHSYWFECSDERDVMSTTFYGRQFVSSIHHNNVYGVQFHPEKSHQNGINLLKNFATI